MNSRKKYAKWYYPTNDKSMNIDKGTISDDNKKYSEINIMKSISRRLYMKNAIYDIGIIF